MESLTSPKDTFLPTLWVLKQENEHKDRIKSGYLNRGETGKAACHFDFFQYIPVSSSR